MSACCHAVMLQSLAMQKNPAVNSMCLMCSIRQVLITCISVVMWPLPLSENSSNMKVFLSLGMKWLLHRALHSVKDKWVLLPWRKVWFLKGSGVGLPLQLSYPLSNLSTGRSLSGHFPPLASCKMSSLCRISCTQWRDGLHCSWWFTSGLSCLILERHPSWDSQVIQ